MKKTGLLFVLLCFNFIVFAQTAPNTISDFIGVIYFSVFFI